MRVIDVRNVHQAIPEGARLLLREGVPADSRAGPVARLPVPLTTVYQRPVERVEFHAERDSNPFFHAMEALWMLAGRDDVSFPARFNSRIGQFSDDGRHFNGAYGYRWRHHFGRDQLNAIASALEKDPQCRRQVLTMWDARRDLALDSKDLPCNTQAYFQVAADGRLDLMVTNRSNDLIWGAYGANAVHFSFLQEYMAARLGREVGTYYQTSFNTHYYVERHAELVAALAGKAAQPSFSSSGRSDPYSRGEVAADVPAVSLTPGAWRVELEAFLQGDPGHYDDPLFAGVAVPLETAYRLYKAQDFSGAIDVLEKECRASDWRTAALSWIHRRLARRIERQTV